MATASRSMRSPARSTLRSMTPSSAPAAPPGPRGGTIISRVRCGNMRRPSAMPKMAPSPIPAPAPKPTPTRISSLCRAGGETPSQRLREEAVGDGGVHRDADRHRVFVQDHAVGVTGRDMAVSVMPVRSHAEKHDAAGHALQDVGEIFGPHDRCRAVDIISGAEQLGRNVPGEIDKPGIVDSHRIAALDPDLGLTEMR